MAQASLNPGVGTFVKDERAPVLANGSTVSTTSTGSWVKVDRPWDCAIVLGTGTVTGTGSVEVEILAADDNSGTNPVSLGKFSTVAFDDDDLERILIVSTHKPYMQASYVATGTVGLPAVITVRDKDFHLSEGRSA